MNVVVSSLTIVNKVQRADIFIPEDTWTVRIYTNQLSIPMYELFIFQNCLKLNVNFKNTFCEHSKEWSKWKTRFKHLLLLDIHFITLHYKQQLTMHYITELDFNNYIYFSTNNLCAFITVFGLENSDNL
jgi:hypothetical protein